MGSLPQVPALDGMTPLGINPARRKCVECGRIFDLRDETDAAEWTYGHDCEAS